MLVAAIIDVNAFTSVVTGMLLAWPIFIGAALGASVLSLIWMTSVRTLVDRGLLAPFTIAIAILSLAGLSTTLWMRATYLTNAAFSGYAPVLQGSLQVAVNTDMTRACHPHHRLFSRRGRRPLVRAAAAADAGGWHPA